MENSRYDPRYDPRAPDEEAPRPFAELPPPPEDLVPQGEMYDWYIRGVELLDAGDSTSSVQLLQHVASSEPESRMVREALARAQFDAGMYEEALANFEWIIAINPADDYSQFGLGLAATKMGDLQKAVDHLALAAAMRPDINYYAQALRGARAALTASHR
ncbi:MAG: tetratricopeptide repeat protein [Actinobacteria bacterium]|nr:tetratricopeptide repeat protein [Actinomycetota bacterium]MCA1720187.1 tetratricopeptide repeat protein [Actinomycetota bacterium]